MKKIFGNSTNEIRISVSMLLLRLVLGAGMIIHGWPKIQNPTTWAGDGFPAFLQLLAAISEFGGGIAWIIGCLSVLASFGIFCTMGMATYFHMIVKGDPFVGKDGSYELALIYFVFALAIMIAGPGRFTVDQYLFKDKK